MLPEHVQIRLKSIQNDFEDGDITLKGYCKQKLAVLHSYLPAYATEAIKQIQCDIAVKNLNENVAYLKIQDLLRLEKVQANLEPRILRSTENLTANDSPPASCSKPTRNSLHTPKITEFFQRTQRNVRADDSKCVKAVASKQTGNSTSASNEPVPENNENSNLLASISDVVASARPEHDQSVTNGKKRKAGDSEASKEKKIRCDVPKVSQSCVQRMKGPPARCTVCKQCMNGDLVLYNGHPNGAVDEFVALTHPKLMLFTGDECVVDAQDVFPHNKVTQFTVYDQHGHLCPFDTGLVEENVPLYMSGYLKPIYEEDASCEGGVAAKDLGPISEWWVSGFDGGEHALLGVTTAYGQYYLMDASRQYEPMMRRLRQKVYLSKCVIEFLSRHAWQTQPTYEDLLSHLQTVHGRFTEEKLLRHAQFVCEQVGSFDEAADSDEALLVTTPCMRALVQLAGVTFAQRRQLRRQPDGATPASPGVATSRGWYTRATTTELVRRVFEAFFPEQLDGGSAPRRTRCGECSRCRRPDCRQCPSCRDKVKYGGAGRSKQACIQRRCVQDVAIATAATDESETEHETVRTQTSCKRMLHPVHWTSAVSGRGLYVGARVGPMHIAPGDCVMLYAAQPHHPLLVARVLFMYDGGPGERLFHGRLFCRAADTVLGDVGDRRELYVVDVCEVCPLGAVVCKARVLLAAQEAAGDDEVYFCQKKYDRVLGRFEDLHEERTEDANEPRKESEDLEDVHVGSRVKVGEETMHTTQPDTEEHQTSEGLNEQRDGIPGNHREAVEKMPVIVHTENLGTGEPVDAECKENHKTLGESERRAAEVRDTREERFEYRYCAVCRRKRNRDIEDTPTFSNGVIWWKNEVYKAGCGVYLVPGTFTFATAPVVYNGQIRESDPVDEEIFPEYYRKRSEVGQYAGTERAEPFCVGYVTDVVQQSLGLDADLQITVQKLYRPENTHRGAALALQMDLNLVYWSDEALTIPFGKVVSRCHLAYGDILDTPAADWVLLGPDRFYFQQSYCAQTQQFVPVTGTGCFVGRQSKGKKKHDQQQKCSELSLGDVWPRLDRPLRTMDVFAGCGGLSEGLHQSGVAETLWAIEKEEAAAQAFKLNHPQATVYTEDCNALLSRIMEGASHTAAAGGQPLPGRGDVELLCGGPPCQGFSGMNRFSAGQYSRFKNSLIATYLSYCDYYRPQYFVLENVRNFSTFKRGAVLKLTLKCLLTIGYQCAFGVLQAGSFGVPQSRRRLFILAAAPGQVLPRFPEPTHVFNRRALQLSVVVDSCKFAPASAWLHLGAPYRTITVRDAMSDLPAIRNGASAPCYDSGPISHFQRLLRDQNEGLHDHVCKEMAPIVEARMTHVPTTAGSDWRDLPNIVVRLTDGTYTNRLAYPYHDRRSGKSDTGMFRGVCACSGGGGKRERCSAQDRQHGTLIPWCLPHTASRHNQWAGLYGRLEWAGVFNTTVTNPEPMGKQGRVLHPEQHRVVSVRECARSQGFRDGYRLCGGVLDRYRQVGNAVPPPLAAAVGRELVRAVHRGQNLRVDGLGNVEAETRPSKSEIDSGAENKGTRARDVEEDPRIDQQARVLRFSGNELMEQGHVKCSVNRKTSAVLTEDILDEFMAQQYREHEDYATYDAEE